MSFVHLLVGSAAASPGRHESNASVAVHVAIAPDLVN
jgi:hypothetical protein